MYGGGVVHVRGVIGGQSQEGAWRLCRSLATMENV